MSLKKWAWAMSWKQVIEQLLSSVQREEAEGNIVEWHEISRWPDGLLSALIRAKLLLPAGLAKHVVCPGCEQACRRKVQRRIGEEDLFSELFVICAQRDDIFRVELAPDELRRWQITRAALFQFASLELTGAKTALPADYAEAPQNLILSSGEIVELDLSVEPRLAKNAMQRALHHFMEWDGQAISMNMKLVADFIASSLSKHAGQSSSLQEKQCGQWLAQIPEKPRMKKKDIRIQAMEKFPGLSRRGFDRVWASHAHASWKKRGRIKKKALFASTAAPLRKARESAAVAKTRRTSP